MRKIIYKMPKTNNLSDSSDNSSLEHIPHYKIPQKIKDEIKKSEQKQSLPCPNTDVPQIHKKPTNKEVSTDTSTSVSITSLTSSIFRFRGDFEDLKCKMLIFGESLSLCKCIAEDFKGKLTSMEKRLQTLEKKHRVIRGESNYSAIINKNKLLSTKTVLNLKKLQMCGTEDEMRDVAARICRNYLHGAWKVVEPSQLDFRRISGGLSNFLYYVALPDDMSKHRAFADLREQSPEVDLLDKLDNKSIIGCRLMKQHRSNSFSMDEPKKVLLRIYGQVHGERAMDAIVTESVIFTLLSERRLGPKLHGVFSGGRIEQYIPARALMTKELGEPALSMKIAEKMAAIHCMDVPLSKEPNWLWKTMGKWLKTVREERLATKNINQEQNTEEEQIKNELKSIDFEKEIEWLKKFISTVDSPVVFCHNDMQEGNILMLEDMAQSTTDDDVTTVYMQQYDERTLPNSSKENNHTKPIKTKSYIEPLASYDEANTSDSMSSHISDSGEPKLVLIDFEYCAYNYRGFDIANHFQEWGYDYTNPEHPFYFENQENCPTLEQKEIFIREYLKHYHGCLDDKDVDPMPTIDDVNHLLSEVDAFALTSHLFWCLWSIVNASKSQIPFGYWEYAKSRLDTYIGLKQEVIKKDKYGFPQKRKICEVDI